MSQGLVIRELARILVIVRRWLRDRIPPKWFSDPHPYLGASGLAAFGENTFSKRGTTERKKEQKQVHELQLDVKRAAHFFMLLGFVC